MIIRLAQIDDVPAVVDIYNQAIPSRKSTGDTQPLRVEERLTWFREHRPDAHPIFVAEAEGQVAGWCSLSPYRPGLRIRHLFAIVLEGNRASLKLLENLGFEQWGFLPRVADFDGDEVGHLYYGRHL